MPRPLIVKVDSHKSQRNKKATGSIDVQLLRGTTKGSYYENYHTEADYTPSVADNDRVNPPGESGSKSIVRNLISRYETSTDKVNLIKYKSKSLADLQKPQPATVAKKTQDDFLYNRGKYGNDEAESHNFDFKKVFLKFETSKHAEPKITRTVNANPPVTHLKHYKTADLKNDTLDLSSITQKAIALLELHHRGHDYSSWQDQVLEFLQQIEKLDGASSGNVNRKVHTSCVSKNEQKHSPAIHRQEHNLQRAKSVDHGELSKHLKVRDIKNIFESKVDDTKPLTRSISSYATYFGLKSVDGEDINFSSLTYSQRGLNATPFNEDFNNNQTGSNRSEDEDYLEDSYDVEYANAEISSDVVHGNGIKTQPIPASSMKIQELKNLFESTNSDTYVPYKSYIQKDKPEEVEDVHVVENRMRPPPTINYETNGADSVEDSMQLIEEITKDIEDYEVQIANITEENIEEGSYLSEMLIKLMIKLDDIKTYGDAIILTERRKAIQFVQHCISKLREKVKETE